MEQWEYWTTFCWANIENPGAREYLKKKAPNWNPPKFTPQTMIPDLNAYGEKGWELVHMEPVAEVGNNGDVAFVHGAEVTVRTWSNVYFCVFKRRKQSGE
jgi:hypothetical protein